jgi:hypothetical protein
MAAKTLEDALKLIEKQNKRIQALEDVHQIHNLMGRYVWRHNVGMDATFPDTLYAKKVKGVSSEVVDWGRYEDDDFRKRYKSGKVGFPPGNMIMHHLDTPVVEVAGDGKTAKGVWLSPGHETYADLKTGLCTAHWCWCKYGMDFVKEEGQWKIWHYHVYRIFKTPFHTPWTDDLETRGYYAPPAEMAEMMGPEVKPTRPTTYDHPYTTKTAVELVPEPPDPYETWDESKAY